MNSRKRSQPAGSSSDDIVVRIPRNKATGGAAGAVVGGIVGGPLGAVVGGVVGASMAGNRAKVKDAVVTGVKAAKDGLTAARKSDLGKRITKAATEAGESIVAAYRTVEARVKKAVADRKSKTATPTAKPVVKPKAAGKSVVKAKSSGKAKPAAQAKSPAKKSLRKKG